MPYNFIPSLFLYYIHLHLYTHTHTRRGCIVKTGGIVFRLDLVPGRWADGGVLGRREETAAVIASHDELLDKLG